MKKSFKIVISMIIILACVFFLGPRPKVDAENTFDISSLGDDLDQYLVDAEANIPNIKHGTQKEIIWADPVTKEQTDLAIIYVHGFSAAKPEIRPVPDIVAKAFDANLYYTRLVGSGRDSEGMNDGTISKWVSDYAEAIAIGERIGKKIIVMATSNGASIATFNFKNPQLSKNVIGFISVSGAYELQAVSNRVANIPWAHTIVPLVMGNTISWKPANEEQKKWWTTEYPISATFPMMALMNHVAHMDKSDINIPALFIYSPNDKVVRPAAIMKTAEEWGGDTKIMTIKQSATPFSHVIAGDIMNPDNNEVVSRTMIEWIEGL